MRLLLDTHAALWAATEPDRLSVQAREALADPANARFLSAVSVWEMAIKAGLGKLDLGMPIDVFVSGLLSRSKLVELAVTGRHAIAVAALPPVHRDPFDRLLVAQARVESLTLVTADPLVRQYDVATLW